MVKQNTRLAPSALPPQSQLDATGSLELAPVSPKASMLLLLAAPEDQSLAPRRGAPPGMHSSAMNQACAGLNLFVAVTLMFAAIGKSRGIQPVERLLVDTLPGRLWRVRGVDSRKVAWLTVVIEVVSGLALLMTPHEAYPAVSGAVVIPLIIIIAVALRAAVRKVPCGCFGASPRKRESTKSGAPSCWH